MTITNKELAKYNIVIEIKDSIEKFRIGMHEGRLLLLRRNVVKENDELEKNKDNLGAVVVNRLQKTSIEYSDFESFYNTIKK